MSCPIRIFIDKKYLTNSYFKEKKSINQIADEYGCSITPIRRLLKLYNIKSRSLSEACTVGETGKYKRTHLHKEIQRIGSIKRWEKATPEEIEKYKLQTIGENNPNWHGGIYHKEYGCGFGEVLKEKIRARDGYVCQECRLPQWENGRQLDCHHIDYNKNNHDEKNLIALCRSCHAKTSYNKEYWIMHFTLKIQKKYKKVFRPSQEVGQVQTVEEK
jgi:5-methylcytosine-specific restriction endonuclease McrA